MPLKSILKPEGSVITGLAESAIILAIYTKNIPDLASVRTALPHDTDIEAARKRSAVESFAVLSLVFLLTRDLGSYIIGGLVLTAADLHVKHSNGVHPATGTLTPPAVGAAVPSDEAANAQLGSTGAPTDQYAEAEQGTAAYTSY